MAADELFQAINPVSTKHFLHLDTSQYDLMLAVVLANLQEHGSMTFNQLGALVEEQLQNNFDGSVIWYFTMVKLDLEACGVIHCLPGSEPQMIEISQ
jgi:hypothetical protein